MSEPIIARDDFLPSFERLGKLDSPFPFVRPNFAFFRLLQADFKSAFGADESVGLLEPTATSTAQQEPLDQAEDGQRCGNLGPIVILEDQIVFGEAPNAIRLILNGSEGVGEHRDQQIEKNDPGDQHVEAF